MVDFELWSAEQAGEPAVARAVLEGVRGERDLFVMLELAAAARLEPVAAETEARRSSRTDSHTRTDPAATWSALVATESGCDAVSARAGQEHPEQRRGVRAAAPAPGPSRRP